MCGNTTMTNWRTLHASVRGNAHHRANLPNQDAWRIAQAMDQTSLIMALADGHGSARSFRSQYGSQLAVIAARKVCANLCKLNNLALIHDMAQTRLPLELVRLWRERVDDWIKRYPLDQDPKLAELDSPSQNILKENKYLAYGSTVLAVMVTPAFILYLQLGDGDILTVSKTGDVERPFPRDPRLIGNETTSLCSPKAWNEVQVYFQPLASSPPALILAATDGYANSFRDDASFQKVALDYWTLLREEGESAVQPSLEEWLNEVSQQGSGDDITVSIAYQELQ